MFSERPGVGIGDPYLDTVKPDPRDKGLNLRVPTCRSGKNNDATFDKFKPLFEGEKFVVSSRSYSWDDSSFAASLFKVPKHTTAATTSCRVSLPWAIAGASKVLYSAEECQQEAECDR